MKKYDVICPYCGAKAELRPANVIYGRNERSNGEHLYVCRNYPKCDAYVAAHHASKKPMGSLANGDLRHLRKIAHIELNKFQHRSGMTKWAAYVWLAAKLGLTSEETHIGKFSENLCKETIRLCRQRSKQTNIRKRNHMVV